MSPQVTSGNQQPGRRQSSGKPTQQARSGQRPPAKPGQSRGAGQRGAPPNAKYTARGQTGPRPGTRAAAKPPGRFSPSALAFGIIGLVVVLVVALILVKVVGGSGTPNGSSTGPVDVAAPASLVDQVTGVTPAEAATVGVPSGVTAPQLSKGQVLLTKSGLPWVLFIGGEFCPYCAAERWALVMALSRFGTLSGLQLTTSSPYDTDPSTATFSFYGATYTSSVIHFDGIEHVSNDTTGLGTRTTKVPLTSQESNLWSQWSTHFGVNEGFPFVDFGNQVLVMGPQYNPAVLSGLDQSGIAAKLSNPNDPVTQAIVGTANYLTAAICSITGDTTSMWCSAGGTKAAAKSLGIS